MCNCLLGICGAELGWDCVSCSPYLLFGVLFTAQCIPPARPLLVLHPSLHALPHISCILLPLPHSHSLILSHSSFTHSLSFSSHSFHSPPSPLPPTHSHSHSLSFSHSYSFTLLHYPSSSLIHLPPAHSYRSHSLSLSLTLYRSSPPISFDSLIHTHSLSSPSLSTSLAHSHSLELSYFSPPLSGLAMHGPVAAWINGCPRTFVLFMNHHLTNRTFTEAPCVPGLGSVKLSSLYCFIFVSCIEFLEQSHSSTSLSGLAVRGPAAVNRWMSRTIRPFHESSSHKSYFYRGPVRPRPRKCETVVTFTASSCAPVLNS